MNRTQLRKAAQISSNAMAKLGRDEVVNISILGKICSALDCDFGDIVEYIKDGAEHD